MPFTQDDLLKFKGLYIETSRKYLENMLIHLASLLTEQTEESLHGMRVSAHSLAGQSSMAGYKNIAQLCFAIEKFFVNEHMTTPLQEDLLKQIQQGVEKMLLSVDAIEKGEEELDLSEETTKLDGYHKGNDV